MLILTWWMQLALVGAFGLCAYSSYRFGVIAGIEHGMLYISDYLQRIKAIKILKDGSIQGLATKPISLKDSGIINN